MGVMSAEHHPPIIFISAEKKNKIKSHESLPVFSKHSIREKGKSSQILARLIHSTSDMKTQHVFILTSHYLKDHGEKKQVCQYK